MGMCGEAMTGTDADDLHAWFCDEVLPLEAALLRYLRRNHVSESELADIRQDIYERVLTGAMSAFPRHTKAYVFTIARNLLINRARRARIVSLEYMAPADLPVDEDQDLLTPERHADARARLRKVEAGIERLPPRCREVIRLRKVEGFSNKEVAQQLSVGVDAVEQQVMLGMRALVDFMLGGEGKIRRRPAREKRR